MSDFDNQPLPIRLLLRFIGGAVMGAIAWAVIVFLLEIEFQNPLKVLGYTTLGFGVAGVILPDPFWEWLAGVRQDESIWRGWRWPW